MVEILLSSLRTVVKLMPVAHEDGATGLVELLEQSCESTAAEAAYALRDRAGDRLTE